jgi:hypothetical protein
VQILHIESFPLFFLHLQRVVFSLIVSLIVDGKVEAAAAGLKFTNFWIIYEKNQLISNYIKPLSLLEKYVPAPPSPIALFVTTFLILKSPLPFIDFKSMQNLQLFISFLNFSLRQHKMRIMMSKSPTTTIPMHTMRSSILASPDDNKNSI